MTPELQAQLRRMQLTHAHAAQTGGHGVAAYNVNAHWPQVAMGGMNGMQFRHAVNGQPHATVAPSTAAQAKAAQAQAQSQGAGAR